MVYVRCIFPDGHPHPLRLCHPDVAGPEGEDTRHVGLFRRAVTFFEPKENFKNYCILIIFNNCYILRCNPRCIHPITVVSSL